MNSQYNDRVKTDGERKGNLRSFAGLFHVAEAGIPLRQCAGMPSRRNVRLIASGKGLVGAGLVAALALLSGCADWSSTPQRTMSGYGLSVRNMMDNQLYDPAKSRQPAALAPDGIEGNKAARVLEKTYRGDLGNPQRIEQKSTLGVLGRGSGSGSGSSSSGSQ